MARALAWIALTWALLGTSAAVAQLTPPTPQAPTSPPPSTSPPPGSPDEAVPPAAPLPPAAPAPEAPQVPAPPGAEPVPPVPEPAQLQCMVIDAAAYGIDAVVGRHVTDQLRSTAEAMGYRVLSRDETVAAAQRMRMPYPPTPADLWRVSYVSQSQRGVFARSWAHAGSYVIEITVASLDNTGPFFARGNSGASDLHEVVDRLLREALPAPQTWRGGQAPTQGQAQASAAAPGAPQAPAGTQPMAALIAPAAPPPEPEPPLRHRFQLALQTEGAIGTSQDSFYNHLVGLRADYRVSREILFGAYAGYANLRGKDGRTGNILMYAQVEDRVRVSSASDITVPLRLGVGYLPFNGPMVRLAAGINIPVGENFEFGFDILAPTFWVLPDRTAVSLDLAGEIIWRL